MQQFYSNEFDFKEDQLIQLINAFNILDNINLLGSVVLYKIGKYEYNINLNIPKEYFNKITLKNKKIELNEDILIKYSQLNILKWFYHNISFDFKNYFMYSCINGHLEVAKWLYQIGKETRAPINIHINSEEAFRGACANGHLEVAKWLYQIETNSPINIHINSEYSFTLSCGNGHLEVAKWLYNLGIETNSPINIHVKSEFAFKNACRNGHLEVVKWLYNLGNEINSPIKITNYKNLFLYSCKNGHLEAAKWLYQIGFENDHPIDIHDNNDNAYNESNQEIKKWLETL